MEFLPVSKATSTSHVQKNERELENLVHQPEKLKLTLMRNDGVLDQPIGRYEETLLHRIAGFRGDDLTSIVQPYLNHRRVNARNSAGETVLEVFIGNIGFGMKFRDHSNSLQMYAAYFDKESVALETDRTRFLKTIASAQKEMLHQIGQCNLYIQVASHDKNYAALGHEAEANRSAIVKIMNLLGEIKAKTY